MYWPTSVSPSESPYSWPKDQVGLLWGLRLNLEERAIAWASAPAAVSAVEDADIIRITVTNEDADEAAKIANEIAKVFSDKIKELYKINNINVLDQAVPDYIPSNINHTKDVIIFAFIGVVISVAYVLIANMLDTTIKSTEDIEKGFGIPVLVSIPIIDNITNVKGGKRK